MASVYHKLERAKMFIRFFIEKEKPICALCGQKIRWESFYPRLEGWDRDEYTLHHLNHNRKCDIITNKEIVHRDCHRKHHRIEQLAKQSQRKYVYQIYHKTKGKIQYAV